MPKYSYRSFITLLSLLSTLGRQQHQRHYAAVAFGLGQHAIRRHARTAAVTAAERFYPAFQLVAWADKSPADAMRVAIAEAYGRA